MPIIQNFDEIFATAASSGRDECRFPCPHCARNPGDKTLSVNAAKGVAYCHRCQATHKGDAPADIVEKQLIDLARERLLRTRRFERLRKSCVLPQPGDPVDLYLQHRLGQRPQTMPDVGLGRYFRRDDAGKWNSVPAMVAPMFAPDGELVGLHATMLTPDGRKAFGSDSKRVNRLKELRGSAIRLYPATDTIIVAEGIETALALYQASGVPAWACTSASLLKAFEPPEGIERIVIAGDNDANGTGQQAAWHLHDKLKFRARCSVMIPASPGTDWLDQVRAEA